MLRAGMRGPLRAEGGPVAAPPQLPPRGVAHELARLLGRQGPKILFLKLVSSIFRQSSNPLCGFCFSNMEQVTRMHARSIFYKRQPENVTRVSLKFFKNLPRSVSKSVS